MLWYNGQKTEEIGASYFELLDHGYTGRRDLGLDARAELFRRLRVSGMAVMSAIEGRLAEGDITPALRLNQDFELTAFFRHTSPAVRLISRAGDKSNTPQVVDRY